MSSLKNSIAVLAATTPPPFKEKMQALADVNARIASLETELGLPHKLPTLNTNRAQARLAELETQRAGKPVSAKLPPLPDPAALMAAITPAAALPADVRPLADYLKLKVEDRLQFIADGFKLSRTDYSKMNLAQQSAYCGAWGQIHEDRQWVKNPSGMGGRWE